MFNFLDNFKNWFNIDGTPMVNDVLDITGKTFGDIATPSNDWLTNNADSKFEGFGNDF
jgi:hypothetical protein